MCTMLKEAAEDKAHTHMYLPHKIFLNAIPTNHFCILPNIKDKSSFHFNNASSPLLYAASHFFSVKL